MTSFGSQAPAEPGEDQYAALTGMLAELADASDAQQSALRDRIIATCLPLADHIARRFTGRGEPFEDLVQVARIGLVKAVDGFDTAKDRGFLAYAVPTMMGEVRRYFRDQTWATHVPRRVKENHQRIASAAATLGQRLGRAPRTAELARELDIEPGEVIEAIVAGNTYRTTSLQSPRGDGPDENTQLGDVIGEEDNNFELVDNAQTAIPLLAALSDRQRLILKLRFFDNHTQSQIAARLGISQMHVSRLLTQTLSELRQAANQTHADSSSNA